MTAFCNIALFALMIEAVSTSETSVNFYQTTRDNIPGDGHLQQCAHYIYKVKPSSYAMEELGRGKI
jgi:hypothetical protein